MELELVRSFYANGTNGILCISGEAKPICYTIELPWKNNEPRISCIPEGRYRVEKRYSAKHHHHLVLNDVPSRSAILIHPANNAIMELKGCIAPVTILTGAGKGSSSKDAMKKLLDFVDQSKDVFLTIKSKQDDNQRKDKSADSALLRKTP